MSLFRKLFNSQTLSAEGLKQIRDEYPEIKLDDEYIKKRYKEFMREFPDGTINKAQMRQIFHDYFSLNRAQTGEFADALFNLFDENKNGSIAFPEYLRGIYMSTIASDRAQWVFKLYKGDMEGITYKNALRLVTSMYNTMGLTARHSASFDEPEKVVQWMFTKSNKPTNDIITLEEFKSLVQRADGPFKDGLSVYGGLL